MNITVFILTSIFLFLGIIYIIYSVKVAEVQDELDEQFDEKAFSKPDGWKIGKMPPELQNQKRMRLKKNNSQKAVSVVEDFMGKWEEKNLTRLNKTDYQK